MAINGQYNLVKRLAWEPSYVETEDVYPGSATEGIYAKDWDAWEDPFHMNYRRYIEVQAKKEFSFHPTRESFARFDDVDRVDRRWLEGVKIVYPYLLLGEYGANRSHARVSRYAPAPALRQAAFYQSIDELRHSQNHIYQLRVLNQAGDEGYDGWSDWMRKHFLLRPSRQVFEDMLSCDNIFESIVALNLAVEVGFTNLIFIAIPHTAANNGDTALAQEFLTTQSDETRHMAIGQSTVRTLLEADDRNLDRIQYWFDKWFWLNHRAVAGPVSLLIDYFGRNKSMSFKEAYQRYVIENFIGGMVEDLGKFGLKAPWMLDHARTEIDDLSHSLFRTLYMYKGVLFNKMFEPNEHDMGFFHEHYSNFGQNHGKFWQEVADGDTKDMAVLPMLCQVCQFPVSYPLPETASVKVREYGDQVYSFCSEPCAWIFDNEPVRYSKAVTMDKLLTGMDVPEIRAYMGLRAGHGGLIDPRFNTVPTAA